jgi:ABC-2 type transport system permease protein
MSANAAFVEVKDRGWMNGFANLFRKDSHRWWGTRTWLIQMFIWILLLDGVMASEALSAQTHGSAGGVQSLEMFFIMAGLGPVIGVVILGQDALIEERKAGTAAWVFSKPVSRAAFLLSKLSAYALGILVTMVMVPGGIAYFIYTGVSGLSLPITGFLAGLGLVYLLLLYFLALSLMLGSLFRSRGAVIGIPLVMVFGANASTSPWLGLILPWTLAMTFGPESPALALRLAQGQPLPSAAIVISTALLVVLFTIIAVVRFRREEF